MLYTSEIALVLSLLKKGRHWVLVVSSFISIVKGGAHSALGTI